MATQKLAGKKVAIITENGFEEVELTKPLQALKDAGVNAQIVSPQKDKVKAWDHDHWSIECLKKLPKECTSMHNLSLRSITPGSVFYNATWRMFLVYNKSIQ